MTTTTDTLTDLHRAILLDPADDTARLVYADALDEPWQPRDRECPKCKGSGCEVVRLRDHDISIESGCPPCSGSGRISNGYAERAEYIRVGVELEPIRGLVPGGAWRNYHLRRDWLIGRERELLLENWKEWTPEIRPDTSFELVLSPRWEPTGTPAVEFRRGFVSSLTLPAAAFTESLARQAFASQPVTRVVLSDRRPYWNGGGYGWFRSDRDNPSDNVNPSADIIGPILVCLRGWSGKGSDRWRSFPSEPLAQLALSDACVCWGRRLAGLPDLPLPTELEPR